MKVSAKDLLLYSNFTRRFNRIDLMTTAATAILAIEGAWGWAAFALVVGLTISIVGEQKTGVS